MSGCFYELPFLRFTGREVAAPNSGHLWGGVCIDLVFTLSRPAVKLGWGKRRVLKEL